MKRMMLAAGAATLALTLPATAALADGYNARPAYMQPKPKPKAKPAPRAHAKPVAAPHKQARHKPRVHQPRPHGYAAAHVQYEELETVETSFTQEVNGRVSGPYTSYSERYVAPHRGCHPQAPCGYSTGTPYARGVVYGHSAYAGGAHGGHHDAHHAEHHTTDGGHSAHAHGGRSAHGGYHDAHHAEHHTSDGGHSAHGGRSAHGGYHDAHHAEHHISDGGHPNHQGYPGAYHGSSYGHGASTAVHPGFHHGALTGGVGYGVDGGPVYGASTVVVRPGGYGQGFGVRGSRFSSASSSASAYSSAQSYGGASVGHSQGFGYGPSYGSGGNGYLGFKPSPHGHGVGATGYGGFRR
jgi:hypothetical protein